MSSPDINMQEIASFYETLYLPGTSYTSEELEAYLQCIPFPELTVAQRRGLDATITLEKLQEAVGSFPNYKAPGEYGNPIEIYKQYPELLLPHLLKVFSVSQEQGVMPPSMSKANIILLLKPGKDPVDPESYRPISLLQCDMRFLAKC